MWVVNSPRCSKRTSRRGNTFAICDDISSHYPMEHTPETSDILYWSKERVSRRLVVSVTHLAISRTTHGPSAYAIASKQIYGTHYFDASLGLTVLVRDRSVSSPAMYRGLPESIASRYFRRAVRRHRADDCQHAGTLPGCHTARTTAAINGAPVCAPSAAFRVRADETLDVSHALRLPADLKGPQSLQIVFHSKSNLASCT